MTETITSTPWTRLMARAMKDREFRTRLLADPATTLKEAAGIIVPEGKTIKIVENTKDVMYMVLPPYQDQSLSDAELERVAAGIYPIARTAACTADCTDIRGQ